MRNYIINTIYPFTIHPQKVKGDNFNTEMSSKSYNSYEESNADLKKRNEIYAQAVPYLEKANKPLPTDRNSAARHIPA